MKRWLYFFIFVFGIIITVNLPSRAEAEGLTISPPITQVTLKAGNWTTQKMILINPTSDDITVYPIGLDFVAEGEEGVPAVVKSEDASRPYSLEKWLNFHQSKVIIPAKKTVDFNYNIVAPKDAEPGGHYGAVFFVSEAPDVKTDDSRVSIDSMIGQLIFLTVPGNITKRATLEDFYTDHGLYFSNQVKLTTRIKNEGNVHVAPVGTIEIKSIFGRVIDRIELNPQKRPILPNSTRKYENVWKGKFLVGPYFAETDITAGKETLKSRHLIWVTPWWFLALILALIFGTIYLYKKKKRKKKEQKIVI